MAEWIYQKQDQLHGSWREVSKQEVLNLIKRQMGESLVDEVLTEMQLHGMELPREGTGQAYRAVVRHPNHNTIGLEAA